MLFVDLQHLAMRFPIRPQEHIEFRLPIVNDLQREISVVYPPNRNHLELDFTLFGLRLFVKKQQDVAKLGLRNATCRMTLLR